jgi:regulator of replication initiation timing
VVADVYNKNTKKLSATIYQLTTQNTLLNLRCEDLETALLNEKKKRQREKPLLYQLQAPEDNNAVLYSPRKIQQA